MKYVYVLAILFFIFGIYFYMKIYFYRKKNILNLEEERKKNPKIAILIPAKNESKVIESLLVSIESQTTKVENQNVFVIVENSQDKTIEIVKKHQMSYFIRKMV